MSYYFRFSIIPLRSCRLQGYEVKGVQRYQLDMPRDAAVEQQAVANFIELLKLKFCLSTKIARLFYTCYLPNFYAIYIACDWYLAVVYLA